MHSRLLGSLRLRTLGSLRMSASASGEHNVGEALQTVTNNVTAATKKAGRSQPVSGWHVAGTGWHAAAQQSTDACQCLCSPEWWLWASGSLWRCSSRPTTLGIGTLGRTTSRHEPAAARRSSDCFNA